LAKAKDKSNTEARFWWW